eukprot:TRINITY_DN16038_c0_g1_i1.p1 TRINITY_DN16038_c0_g1~~TRINITY_DN16038_c0_g1_i1.p1  ORF type:complete len:151 (+),score=19.87 TRINITY_DN16038_c0_g1_i1:68-520(+)
MAFLTPNGETTASLQHEEAGQLKKGGFVMLKGQPCKIADLKISKVGKHGHTKCRFYGTQVFTDAHIEDVKPSSHVMDVPVLVKYDAMVMNVSDDGFLSILCDDGSVRSDMPKPAGELGSKIQECIDADETCSLTVISTLGVERVIAVRAQ